MSERKQIEWAAPTDAAKPLDLTKTEEKKATEGTGFFQDLIFKDKSYAAARLKFLEEKTWIRILPPVTGGKNEGVLKCVEVYEMGNRKWVRTPGRDPVTDVRVWFYKNRKEEVYSKANPGGIKLWGKPTGVAFALLPNNPPAERLKVILASLYAGDRGGTPGLGHQIVTLANEVDAEPGSETLGQRTHGDITDPTAGRLVLVTKTTGGEYASYKASIGKTPAPVAPLLADMSDEDLQKIKPLEDLIFQPSYEEQVQYLRDYLGEAFPEEALKKQS